MKLFTKLSLLAVAALLCVSITGCNTMRGLGQDIERAGEKIQKEAQ